MLALLGLAERSSPNLENILTQDSKIKIIKNKKILLFSSQMDLRKYPHFFIVRVNKNKLKIYQSSTLFSLKTYSWF
jgi:hypothetical protein